MERTPLLRDRAELQRREKPAHDPNLILATGVVGLQALVGLILVLTGSRPAQLIHWFYGGATLASLPLTTWIGRRRSPRAEQLWIVGGALATFLFSVRAIVTG